MFRLDIQSELNAFPTDDQFHSNIFETIFFQFSNRTERENHNKI